MVFKHIYLYLILLDYLKAEDLRNLNLLNILFKHIFKLINYIKLQYIYELFEYNIKYTLKEKIPFKRKMQFLFLALINRLQMPAVIRSLKGNYTTLHRNPTMILAKYEQALDKDLLEQLKRVLNNNNLSKFSGHITVE